MKMNSKLIRSLFMSGLFALTMQSAHAHHAFSAEFDAQQPIELKGVVSKLELVNPHSWLYLDVKQADGSSKTFPILNSAIFFRIIESHFYRGGRILKMWPCL